MIAVTLCCCSWIVNDLACRCQQPVMLLMTCVIGKSVGSACSNMRKGFIPVCGTFIVCITLYRYRPSRALTCSLIECHGAWLPHSSDLVP